VDLGLNLGGPFTDELDDYSFNETLNVVTLDIDFSVDPAPANGGVTVGAPVPAPCAGPFPVNVTTEAAAMQAQGDVFTWSSTFPGPCNTQSPPIGAWDEAALGLIAPVAAPPPLDDIDGLAEFMPAGGTCTLVAGTMPANCAAYTVGAGSPVLAGIAPDPFTGAPVTGATILAQPGALAAPPALPAGCGGPLPCAAVSPGMLGLVMGDDIDALCWFDVLPNGSPDLPIGALGPGSLGDIYLYSLTPGSPSTVGLYSPADLIRAGGPPPAIGAVAIPAATMGLLPTDDLDAAICHDDDSDFESVPDFIDNCDTVPNPGQADGDADTVGDACDNCPTTPNAGQANSDSDTFGDACDTEGPSPNTNGLGGADDCFDGVDNDGDGLTDGAEAACAVDTDGDGVLDAIDNCPLTPNPTQTDFDGDAIPGTQPGMPGAPVGTAWGGDACDIDDDNDLVADADEGPCGGAQFNAGVRPERVDGPFAGVDDDGDTAIDEALPAGAANFDCDGDGYRGSYEAGTSLCGNGMNDDGVITGGGSDDGVVDDGCPGGPAQVGVYSEAQFNIGGTDQDPCGLTNWPSDYVWGGIFGSTNAIRIDDLNTFLAPRRLDTNPGDANFNSRWDLVPGRGIFTYWISIQDFNAMLGGTSGNPPMFGGVRAFNGPLCPW
jgi:hypothetical protein